MNLIRFLNKCKKVSTEQAYPKTHWAMTWRVLPCPQGTRRAEDIVPATGGLSFRAGRRYLFGGKTALGIPARTAALPGTKTQAIMVPMGFRIGSYSPAICTNIGARNKNMHDQTGFLKKIMV